MDGSLQQHRGIGALAMLDGMGHPADMPATTAAATDTAPAPPAETLEQFLDAIAPRAFRFAEAGLRHRDDAMDVLQDAMVKMLAYRDRPPAEWTPLFWTIVRRRIVDAQRRRTFRLGWLTSADERQEAGVEWADDGPDPSRSHDGREAYGVFTAALRELPRRQREAFTLRVLEELDVATTARVMGCGEGSVKTHLSRARGALQKRLEDFR